MNVHGFVLAVRVMIPLVQGHERVRLVPARDRQGVKLSVVGEGFVGPGGQNDVERLKEQCVAFFVVAAVRIPIELKCSPLVDAAANAEINAPAGHIVQHRDVLRDAQRMPIWQDDGAETNTKPLTVVRQVCANKDGVWRRVHEAVVGEVMLRQPDRREVGLVGQTGLVAHHLQNLIPGYGLSTIERSIEVEAHPWRAPVRCPTNPSQ